MSDRDEMEQFAHDHVEHWARVANEAEERAERAEALVRELGEALDRAAPSPGSTEETIQRHDNALAAYHQFLGEGSGE